MEILVERGQIHGYAIGPAGIEGRQQSANISRFYGAYIHMADKARLFAPVKPLEKLVRVGGLVPAEVDCGTAPNIKKISRGAQ